LPSRQTTSFDSRSRVEASSRTFRPKPNWFLIRGIPLGLFALLIFAAAPGAAVLGVMSVIGVALLWLVFKSSSMTLDNEGFTYHIRSFLTHKEYDNPANWDRKFGTK